MRLVLLAASIAACSDSHDENAVRGGSSGEREQATASAEDSVAEVLVQLQRAQVTRDSAITARLLDRDYVGIAPWGDTIKRDAVLATISDTSEGRYDSLINTRPPGVLIEGDSATVEGQMLVHGMQKGQVFIHRANYMYGLRRRPDGWRVTFEQFRHAQ